jgi:hypothetical protein
MARTAARRLAAAAGLAAACSTAPVFADGRAGLPADTPPAYLQECGSCHIAYPPGLLPAASWKRLMTGLDRHFGSDASLDEATTRRLADWLQANAATGSRRAEPPPQDRITRAAWFQREHRKIDAEVWTLPSVKSPANCGACHTQAERGRFDEHELRAPADLDARQRRAFED